MGYSTCPYNRLKKPLSSNKECPTLLTFTDNGQTLLCISGIEEKQHSWSQQTSLHDDSQIQWDAASAFHSET